MEDGMKRAYGLRRISKKNFPEKIHIFPELAHDFIDNIHFLCK
ncbi:hypothetical protein PJIAN_3727 [Paludibacter jiangxiensis]|uniref:Uncharacterized protein n=1 Tax=Paludibacter jiangxiensis TaxID=681398 RepID=A0A171A8Q6_9BACT|nr:hypothetical protein PJIAN_3727 [Paludibacter jiangxiensis]